MWTIWKILKFYFDLEKRFVHWVYLKLFKEKLPEEPKTKPKQKSGKDYRYGVWCHECLMPLAKCLHTKEGREYRARQQE